MLKPSRALVLKEVVDLGTDVRMLHARVAAVKTAGVGKRPLIDNPKELHAYMRLVQDHLDQLYTLLQFDPNRR